MAAVSRRRRFIILIVICCLSLFMFGWYSRTSDGVLKFTENSSPSSEISGSYKASTGFKRPQHLPRPDISQIENELMDFLEDEKASLRRSNDLVFSSREYDDTPITKPLKRQPEDQELFSGPTDYDNDEPMTKSYKRQPDDMELFSGPTDYDDDIPITFPARRHPDLELEFSGPTEYEMPVTVPVRRHHDVELEVSGPTEENVVDGAKQVTPSMQSDEVRGSVKNKADGYPKLSLGGTTPSILQVTKPAKDSSLVLDTPGCKVPKLDPWDPTVKHLIELQEPYECPGRPLFMKSSPGGSITLNETVLEKYYGMKPQELECNYQPIYRKHEDPGNVRENDYMIGNLTELIFDVPLNEDYVVAFCHIENKIFEQYFPLARLKKEIEEVRSSITPPTPRLNIILAGIDSISKLNYLRHFRKTEKFIKEKLNMFEMNGYTKVGDNTFPNLVPMLTGHFVEHYWNESLRDTMYFDDVGLIWKDYAKKGYRTFYAEDSPYTGTFNYIKRGFYDPPTDYYSRPLFLALEGSNIRDNSGKPYCFNSQFEPELIYDYLKDFIRTMENRPYIAFAMVSTITHDYLNHAGWEDQPTVHLLDDLLNMGALNNSLLVLFSDHGLRFGKIRSTYIGKFEERMPFMYIHAPKWFLHQYPQYAKSLEINQNRLITLFDIHATMIHLLDINRPPEERAQLSMGKSLLDEISPNRTCEEANILQHWCPCQTFESVPLNSTEAINASQAIVDDINSKLAEYGNICEILEVAEIVDARVGQANDLVLRFVRHDNVVVNRTVVLGDRIEPIADYMITLTTKPGLAEFEGTVRHDPNNNLYTVLGISRISLYGKTSWCIDSQKMKIFCYCKVQQTS